MSFATANVRGVLNRTVILVALASLVACPPTDESEVRRAMKDSADALARARAAGDAEGVEKASMQGLEAVEQFAAASDRQDRGFILTMARIARALRERMDQHDQRIQSFDATGGCDVTMLKSRAAIDERRVLLRAVRTSADELCVDLGKVTADVDREIRIANLPAAEITAFKKGFDENARLPILTESCASQVKLLAACDEQIALLATHFGHWTVEDGLRFDDTVADDVTADFDKLIARFDAEVANLDRLEKLRMAPAAPK